MTGWLSGIVGEAAAPAVSLIVYGLLIIGALAVLAWLARRLTGGTYVAGGHSRRQRLAVMDAAAVDSRRRLVLVRRDDIEHLILIGGSSDIVVEQNIRITDWLGAGERLETAAGNPAAAKEPVEPNPDIVREVREMAAEDHQPPSAVQKPVSPSGPGQTKTDKPPESRLASTATATSATPAAISDRWKSQPAQQAPKTPPQDHSSDIDSALLDELEESLDLDVEEKPVSSRPSAESVKPPAPQPAEPPTPPTPPTSAQPASPKPEAAAADRTSSREAAPRVEPKQDPATLEDEMERLLRDLSSGNKK